MGDRIYLDYAATTPLDPGVVQAMLPWLTQDSPGNAHARHHTHGNAAHRAVEKSRQQVATAIGAQATDIVFTSGATEGNNLVIHGLVPALKTSGRTHIIASAVEHKSVLAALDALDGFTVTILPVKACGMIEADHIERALTPQTGLVCVQAVNNELGVIQPVEEIAAMLAGRGIFFHIDAAQALGKIPVDVTKMGADFMTLSAHKMHGPQGIGAVYKKTDSLRAIQHGGGQEQNLRAGTLPVFLCAGFGAACDLIADDRARLQNLRNDFLARVAKLNPVIGGHSDPLWNVPGILSLRFPGIDQESLVMGLPDLSFGVGSACAAGLSHVIRATSGSDQAANETIRLSFGRFTTEEDIHHAAEMFARVITEIKTMQEVA